MRSYLVESDLDGRPFSHDERALVYARAKGQEDAHPFGTELDVYSGEYVWLAHSIQPNAHAPADRRLLVGSDQCGEPDRERTRLNSSHYCESTMQFSALNKKK